MAECGRDKVRKYHSVKARVGALLNWASSMLRDRAFGWRVQNQRIVRHELAKAYQFLATDLELGLPLHLREFFAGLGERYRATG